MWWSSCIVMDTDRLAAIPRPKWSGSNSPGLKRRGYLRQSSTYICLAEWCLKGSGENMGRCHFGVVVEIAKDKTAIELVRAKDIASMQWFPIHADVIDSMYQDMMNDFSSWETESEWKRWIQNTQLERDGNRLLFVYDNKFLSEEIISVTKKSVGSTFPYKILLRFCQEIAMCEAFHPKIMGLKTAQAAIDAFRNLYTEHSKVYQGDYTYDEQRKESLENIANDRKAVDQYQAELQAICDKAAESMNLLSEKYGIEVEI